MFEEGEGQQDGMSRRYGDVCDSLAFEDERAVEGLDHHKQVLDTGVLVRLTDSHVMAGVDN